MNDANSLLTYCRPEKRNKLSLLISDGQNFYLIKKQNQSLIEGNRVYIIVQIIYILQTNFPKNALIQGKSLELSTFQWRALCVYIFATAKISTFMRTMSNKSTWVLPITYNFKKLNWVVSMSHTSLTSEMAKTNLRLHSCVYPFMVFM